MNERGVSIALATFNGENYLPLQLRTLAEQTLVPAEVVIVDDGSADATRTIVHDFARSAPFPVRLYENESRLGYRGNFMRAAGLCQFDLIAFCDQDDAWEAHKLAVMTALFDEPAVLLAYHNATVVDAAGAPAGTLHATAPDRMVLPPLTENPWRLTKGFTQVFRRSLLQYSALQPASVDPYWPSESLAHDQWFVFLASVLGNTIRLGAPLARYRQHADNEHGWTAHDHLEPRPHFLLGAAFIAAAENRISLLQRMREHAEPVNRSAIDAAMAYYGDLLRRLRERAALYQAPSIAERIRAVQSLLRQGAYRQRQGPPGFGWTGLLMDVCAGVALGPRAKPLL